MQSSVGTTASAAGMNRGPDSPRTYLVEQKAPQPLSDGMGSAQPLLTDWPLPGGHAIMVPASPLSVSRRHLSPRPSSAAGGPGPGAGGGGDSGGVQAQAEGVQGQVERAPSGPALPGRPLPAPGPVAEGLESGGVGSKDEARRVEGAGGTGPFPAQPSAQGHAHRRLRVDEDDEADAESDSSRSHTSGSTHSHANRQRTKADAQRKGSVDGGGSGSEGGSSDGEDEGEAPIRDEDMGSAAHTIVIKVRAMGVLC